MAAAVAAERVPLRWAVVLADLDPVEGHEQGGTRRVLVVSNEPYHASGRLTVCPITAAWSEPRYPNEVALPKGTAGQTVDGVILCHQVRTISQRRVRTTRVRSGEVHYLTDAGLRRDVRLALARHLRLDVRPEQDEVAGERSSRPPTAGR